MFTSGDGACLCLLVRSAPCCNRVKVLHPCSVLQQQSEFRLFNCRNCEAANPNRSRTGDLTDEIDRDSEEIDLLPDPSQIRSDEKQPSETPTSDTLLLIEPHKPRLNTLSGNQHHIVEYHNIQRHKQSTPSSLSSSAPQTESILKLSGPSQTCKMLQLLGA